MSLNLLKNLFALLLLSAVTSSFAEVPTETTDESTSLDYIGGLGTTSLGFQFESGFDSFGINTDLTTPRDPTHILRQPIFDVDQLTVDPSFELSSNPTLTGRNLFSGRDFEDISRNGQNFRVEFGRCVPDTNRRPAFNLTGETTSRFEIEGFEGYQPTSGDIFNITPRSSTTSIDGISITRSVFPGSGCYDQSQANVARYCSTECEGYRSRNTVNIDDIFTAPTSISKVSAEEQEEIDSIVNCCDSNGVCRVRNVTNSCNPFDETIMAGSIPEGAGDIFQASNLLTIENGEAPQIPGQATEEHCSQCYNTEEGEVEVSQRNLVEEARPYLFQSNMRKFVRGARTTNSYARRHEGELAEKLSNLSEADLREVLGVDDFATYTAAFNLAHNPTRHTEGDAQGVDTSALERAKRAAASAVINKYTCNDFDERLQTAISADSQCSDSALGTLQGFSAGINSVDEFEVEDRVLNSLVDTDEAFGEDNAFADITANSFSGYFESNRETFNEAVCVRARTDRAAALSTYFQIVYNNVFSVGDAQILDSDLRRRYELAEDQEIPAAFKEQYVRDLLSEYAASGNNPSQIPLFVGFDLICNHLDQLEDSESFDINRAIGSSQIVADPKSDSQIILSQARSLHESNCGAEVVEENERLVCGDLELSDLRGTPAFSEFLRSNISSFNPETRVAVMIDQCMDPNARPTNPNGDQTTPTIPPAAGPQDGPTGSSPHTLSQGPVIPREYGGRRRGPLRTDATSYGGYNNFAAKGSGSIGGAEGNDGAIRKLGTSAANFNGGVSAAGSSSGGATSGPLSALDTISQMRQSGGSFNNSSIFNSRRRLSTDSISDSLEADADLAAELQDRTQRLQGLIDSSSDSNASAAGNIQSFLTGDSNTALPSSLVDDERAQALQAEIDDLRAQLAQRDEVRERARPADQRLDTALSEIERLRGTIANLQTTQKNNLAGAGTVDTAGVTSAPVELGSVRGGQFDYLNDGSNGRSPSSIASNAIPTNIASLIQNQSGSVGFAFEGEQLIIRSGGAIYPAELDNIVFANGVVQGIVYRGNQIPFESLSAESRAAIQRFVETNAPELVERRLEEIEESVADIPEEVVRADSDGVTYLQMLEQLRLATASGDSN